MYHNPENLNKYLLHFLKIVESNADCDVKVNYDVISYEAQTSNFMYIHPYEIYRVVLTYPRNFISNNSSLAVHMTYYWSIYIGGCSRCSYFHPACFYSKVTWVFGFIFGLLNIYKIPFIKEQSQHLLNFDVKQLLAKGISIFIFVESPFF